MFALLIFTLFMTRDAPNVKLPTARTSGSSTQMEHPPC